MSLFNGLITALKVLVLLFLGSITLGLGICSIGVGGSVLLSSRLSAFAEMAPLLLMSLALTIAFGAATRQIWKSLQDQRKPDAEGDSEKNDVP